MAEWRPLWQPLPFQYRRSPWCERFPVLEEALLALGAADCERLQHAPFSDTPLAAWLPVAELAQQVSLPPLEATPTGLPPAWSQHVGGRKWRQIEAFVAHTRAEPGQALLEWCAGKGHLARTLARHRGAPVMALEWQVSLCAEARRLAGRQGVAVEVHQQDVLAGEAARWLGRQTHVAALHACGDLHRRLLELAVSSGSAVTLAPCCYQRTAVETYRPLSRQGRQLAAAHELTLSREDLALAVQETVTAPRNVRLKRERANGWRLGFDLLQREIRGQDSYLPVPSLAYGRLPEGFADFCRWAADQKGLTLPERLDWAALERAGRQRQREVSRLELVRHLFRRPLEVWLALDRLLLLEEAGFEIELGTFCSRELTPRNLLLRASLPL
nr:methyltransferase [Halomonas campisalis]